MNAQSSSYERELWRRLVESDLEFHRAVHEFRTGNIDRVRVVGQGLAGSDGRLALALARLLSIAEQQQLFPDFVRMASWESGQTLAARELILGLPRSWVVERIEAEAERFIASGTYQEYRRFLELYDELDRDLMVRLARRAVSHPDPDIREAGEDFLLGVDSEG